VFAIVLIVQCHFHAGQAMAQRVARIGPLHLRP
jgi:hypothetical protein